MPKVTGAQWLAEAFEGYGVSHVFLVPAVLSQTLYEMEQRGSIARIVAHDEKSAAYMADGYARVSRRPGVVMCQHIGSSNLAAGLRDPFLAGSPVLGISGGPYDFSTGRSMYQQIEDLPIFKPVTKFSEAVPTLKRLPDLLRQAFRVATSGRPAPVHLQLPGHMAEVLEGQTADLDPLVEEQFAQVPSFRPLADGAVIAAAVRLLEQAERPVILAGGGARWSHAGPELIALAERLAIPIVTSMNAKDLVPAGHPLLAGVAGTYSRDSANRALLESDLVFVVGSGTGSQPTANWKLPAPGSRVIQLDIEPTELGRHYPNELSILGDAKVSLEAMLQVSDPETAARRSSWTEQVQGYVRQWWADLEELTGSDAIPIRPERLCKALSDFLPSDAILVSDTGHSGQWTGGMIDLNHADQGFIRCGGSLGWGFPAGLGAKLAAPERPVVVWTGDGGFWYHIGELETAVRWGINTVVVVNNNAALNQSLTYVYAGLYGQSAGDLVEAAGQEAGGPGDLWRFTETDFAAVARSMGANGIRVTDPNDLPMAIEQAIASNRPTVVDVVTEVTAMAPPPYMGTDVKSTVAPYPVGKQ
jgi:acetolactate synthase-1/2/3 large subunit